LLFGGVGGITVFAIFGVSGGGVELDTTTGIAGAVG